MADLEFQSGKTQSIDLDELNVTSRNRPREANNSDFDLGSWGGDPWRSTEDGRRKRRWADDEKWFGDNNKETDKDDPFKWDDKLEEPIGGWTAAKRGDVLVAGDGWEHWGEVDGPLKYEHENEVAEFGGYKRVQAASTYNKKEDADYVEGVARRKNLYQNKEQIQEEQGAQKVNNYNNEQQPWSSNDLQMRSSAYTERPRYNDENDFDNMVPTTSSWDEIPKASYNNFEPATNHFSNNPYNQTPYNQPYNQDPYTQQPQHYDPNFMPPTEVFNPVKQPPGPPLFQQPTNQQQPPQHEDEIPGPTRASFIIFTPSTLPVIFEIRKKSLSIGRSLENNIVLNDPFTSRKHLQLDFVNERFELTDLNSDNGTTVNGFPITKILIKHLDQIEIGKTVLRFVFGNPNEQQKIESPPQNGEPHHLIDPPPAKFTKPQNTNLNKILIYASIGVFVLILSTIIIAVIVKSKKQTSPTIENDANIIVEKNETTQPLDLPTNPPSSTTNQLKQTEESANAPAVEHLFTDSEQKLVNDITNHIIIASAADLTNPPSFEAQTIKIYINSTPPNALIFNEDQSLRGITPLEYYDLKSNNKETLTLRLQEHQDINIKVSYSKDINIDELFTPSNKPASKPSPSRTSSSKPKNIKRQPPTNSPPAKPPQTSKSGKKLLL